MRLIPFALAFLKLVAPLSLMVDFQEELEVLDEPTYSSVTEWTMTDAPGIQSGWSPSSWQPSPNGALWDLDFSPDGTKVAAVELYDNRLWVWNVSDGRVLLWAGHSNAMAEVAWLSNDWLLAADAGTNWYSYEVVDNGGAMPVATADRRTGQWTDSLQGTYDGWLWGLDVSANHSMVTFCGNLNHMNMGGEVVIADLAHFTTGAAANARHFLPQFWNPDCKISTDGSLVTALGRNTTGNKDVVYGIDTGSASLQWERFIGGPNGRGVAITYEPGGGSYTVGYNTPHPTLNNTWEGVVASFAQSDGSQFWYSPTPQNISSLEWLPDGNYLTVGMRNPGKIALMDTSGQMFNDFGWHSWLNGSYGEWSDVNAVTTSWNPSGGTANQLVASAGMEGGLEIYTVDVSNSAVLAHRRFGPNTLREISVDESTGLVAVAESSGVVTVRQASNGAISYQCFHPEYGQYIHDIPHAKSVEWGIGEVMVGFDDGVVIGCNSFGKMAWIVDLRQSKTVGSFGRVAYHIPSNMIAVTYSANVTNTNSDGRVTIFDPQSGAEYREWSYPEAHWPLSFSPTGDYLASADQSGDVRIWNTSDPNVANWFDDGVAHSHAGYVGVLEWMPGVDVLVTAGWDKTACFWEMTSQTSIQNLTLQAEPFSFAVMMTEGTFVIGTGDASTSLSGQLEIFDLSNFTTTYYSVTHIPRGLGSIEMTSTYVYANHTGSILTLRPDFDGDGWLDGQDAFPTDPTQHADTDGDGYGDDSSQPNGDGCVDVIGTSNMDRNGCPDSDSDGYSDPDANWHAHPDGLADALPNDPNQWMDSDRDGYGDNYSFQTGQDGLRMAEAGDAFPLDPQQYRDLDGDGCGDNYSYSLDNGNRINERGDAFLSDPTQCYDFDSDGYGDNYTFELDGDGLRIENGDAFELDSLAWSDLDGDGCPTNSATGLTIDLHPTDPERCDEALPFWLPNDLAATITNSDTEWSISVSWSSAASNTDEIRLQYALTDNLSDTPEDGAFTTLQVWTQTGSVDEQMVVMKGQNDKMHLRVMAVPDDGDSLTMDWSAIWVYEIEEQHNESEQNGSEQQTGGGTDDGGIDGDTDGVIDDEGDEQGGGVTSTPPNSDDTSPTIAVVIGSLFFAVVVLLVIGLRYNRKTQKIAPGAYTMTEANVGSNSAFAPPSTPPTPKMHPPCKKCGGFVSEVDHQGAKWTWCPVCSEWQDYLGKR